MLKTIFASTLLVGLLSNAFAGQSLEELTKLSSTGSLIQSVDVMKHLQALQNISDANDGNRAAGTRGHEQSAQYIATTLIKAGYSVELSPFSYIRFKQLETAVLVDVKIDTNIEYKDKEDFEVMAFSGSGSVQETLESVDLDLGLENSSTSGCESEDFDSFSAGKIAVVQRGACAFVDKAQNAQDAGAIAVIIFNQGNEATRMEMFGGTLGNDSKINIPVLSVSYDFAQELLSDADRVLKIDVKTSVSNDVSYNVIAETNSGDADNVVMIGSHLDGVEAGPGINDNGSGSAGILEVALRVAGLKLNNKIRFAWWSAEELGLVGSTRYVEALSEEEKAKIVLYLNFDMIASPNYMIGVFDGNGSASDYVAPKGSYAIENLFELYFAFVGQNSIEIAASGRSDYAAFAEVGIPYGGLFTGAEGAKSDEQAILFGGVAGEAYDSCYHQACDDINNINQEALEINTNAIAFMALNFGYSTASIAQEQAAEEVEQEEVSSGGQSDIGHHSHYEEL